MYSYVNINNVIVSYSYVLTENDKIYYINIENVKGNNSAKISRLAKYVCEYKKTLKDLIFIIEERCNLPYYIVTYNNINVIYVMSKKAYNRNKHIFDLL